MTARQRREHESFGDYREALKEEAKAERVRLKGKWVWRSWIVVPDEEGKLAVHKTRPYRSTKNG